MKKINVAIVGCGSIAQTRHAPEYASNKNVALYAFYDCVYERAKNLADKYGGIAYACIDDLLNDKKIDAVSVCVANCFHASVTIKALNAGKHVLCEKPMALSVEECENMIKAQEKSGKILMIAHDQRFDCAHIKAKEMLDNRAIGKVLTFKSTFGHGGPENWSVDKGTSNWFFNKQKTALGAMADLGVHKTDLLQYLLNDTVCEVYASFTTLDKKYPSEKPIDVEDNAICIFKTKGGVIGTVCASWTYYGESDNSTTIYGSEGIAFIHKDPNFPLVIKKKSGEEIKFGKEILRTNSGVIDSFINSITKDLPSSVDCKEVLWAIKVILGCEISSSKNIPVTIK